MAIDFLPIHDATDRLIQECIESVSDTFQDNTVSERMWARVRAIREGDYPSACDLLLKNWEGVGWSGWFPLWTNPYDSWSSATYLSPRLRGKGLLPVLKCRQIHAAAEICEKLEERPQFVSSIETANVRSLKANFKYSKQSGWPNEWYLYHDKESDRLLLRMRWPEPERAKHQCYLGEDLKQFEETIDVPELILPDDEPVDQKLLIDTWVRRKART